MAARKTTARKKTTRRKATRKRAPARGRKKSARKKTARRKTLGRRIEDELPPNLKEFTRQVRKGLSNVEKQLATARADARKRWARLLRDASHMLGRLEAEGQERWRKQTDPARREAVRLLQRLSKAIGPKPARKRAARKKSARR